MTIEEIYNDFSKQIASLKIYQSTIKNYSRIMLQDYLSEKGTSNKSRKFIEFHSMFFPDITTGEIHLYSDAIRKTDDLISYIDIQKEKQYKWILSETYEYFEVFIEKIYAILGYSDVSTWPLIDFGNIFLSEVSSKPIEWYINRVKEKRDKPDSILNHLRKIFPDISKIEKMNIFGNNLRLSICVIEMIRHITVHKSGKVDNILLFREKILKKAGLYQNGKPCKSDSEFINSLFKESDNEINISLIERKDPKNSELYADILGSLINQVMSYSYYIYETVKRHITKVST